MNQAVVMDIQRFSIHDGPGIRTTVFLKGCHLCCQWCHNPESQYSLPEIMFYQKQCIKCGSCIPLCSRGAHHTGKTHTIDLKLCRECPDMHNCAAVCPTHAIRQCGTYMSADEVIEALRKDKIFYKDGGGVTFSGGEPLLWHSFLKEILPMCKKEGLHVCIDTTLEVPWEQLAKIAQWTDLFLADCKILSAEMAKQYMGRAYQYMPGNLRRLSERKIPVILRVPVAKGVNDTPQEAEARKKLTEGMKNIIRIDTFSVSSHGRSKYEALGRTMEWKEKDF